VRYEEDHFVHLDGVTWADYERLLEIRGDHSAPLIKNRLRPTTGGAIRDYRAVLKRRA